MIRTAIKILFTAFLLLLLGSCVSKKEIIYFQNLPEVLSQLDSVQSNFKIKPNDILNITVSAYDPAAVKPFNLVLESQGGVLAQNQGYLTGADGYINFPVLGKIKAAGLTRAELGNQLTEKISEYILDPIVTINILNFQVSILGAVNRPGTFGVQGERLTLTEAISRAGDLSMYGRRDNVLVLRENNGKKDFAYLDLRDAKIMESDYFYLQQNDLIYVEPNNAAIQSPGPFGTGTRTILSIVSLLVSLIVVFIK
ncbi:polysaccharide biosynthesis/export family protein [Aequorivita capsosiphonis]|uniref:polysaccharide biosynthesis/export family protein n=1 Tax=Aequorivita capsosiphonis TaxID=487317 RepID=UPI000426DBAD|nr:polysaccharide biosynthesis/export family protein [Aequorivita capsosiphonis]